MERIYALHPILLDEMLKHRDRIASILPEQESKEQADSVDRAYLDMLRTSLENEDYGTADFVCEEIRKYQYAADVQVLVEQLAQHIFNLESEEALEIIKQIPSV